MNLPISRIHQQATSEESALWMSASFVGTRGGLVRRLSGWRSNHNVPKEHNSYTRAFVQRLAEPELQTRLEELHGLIKEAFGYKRKQIDASVRAGVAVCQTADFSVEISMEIDPEDPARYLETTSVTSVRSLEILTSDAFAQVFDGQFSQVCFGYSQPLLIETLIDRLEDSEASDLVLRYPPDASRCTVERASEGLCIEFTPHEMRFVLDGKPSMYRLVEILTKGRQLLGV